MCFNFLSAQKSLWSLWDKEGCSLQIPFRARSLHTHWPSANCSDTSGIRNCSTCYTTITWSNSFCILKVYNPPQRLSPTGRKTYWKRNRESQRKSKQIELSVWISSTYLCSDCPLGKEHQGCQQRQVLSFCLRPCEDVQLCHLGVERLMLKQPDLLHSLCYIYSQCLQGPLLFSAAPQHQQLWW